MLLLLISTKGRPDIIDGRYSLADETPVADTIPSLSPPVSLFDLIPRKPNFLPQVSPLYNKKKHMSRKETYLFQKNYKQQAHFKPKCQPDQNRKFPFPVFLL